MPTMLDDLRGQAFFDGLPAAAVELLAGCAVDQRLLRGEFLFREGEPADRFFLVRHGRVAIEIRTPVRAVVLDTIEDGDVVGWSWLVPPRRWTFDSRAVTDTTAVGFDAAGVRTGCEADPRVGYQLTLRFVEVMNRRLHSARIRLLDLYGNPRD